MRMIKEDTSNGEKKRRHKNIESVEEMHEWGGSSNRASGEIPRGKLERTKNRPKRFTCRGLQADKEKNVWPKKSAKNAKRA